MLSLAISYARKIYGEDKDKAGRVAFYHPLGLLAHLDNEIDMEVAILHDVVEDYFVSLDEIGLKFGVVVRDAVDAISRRENEPYFDYIQRCIQNPIASRVKRADLLYNIDRSPQLLDNESLKRRYLKAILIVEDAIKEYENAGKSTD